MPRQGEHTYYEKIGSSGRAHAVGKPFGHDDRGPLLMETAAVLSLIPPAPARVLECGCGTGWLAYILARSGYDVVGQDVSADAIELARSNPVFASGPIPEFVTGDFENLPYRNEFDAVVFFGSLHHAIDEEAALQMAFAALKPGGVAVLSEPGIGHAARSQEVVATYDVTDKDMPPSRTMRIGRRKGFRTCRVYPHANLLQRALFTRGPVVRRLALLAQSLLAPRVNGIVVLVK